MSKNQIKKYIGLLAIGFLTIVSVKALASWNGPSANAPSGNAYPPVHAGTNLQDKIGNIVVGGFRVFGPAVTSLFDGQVQVSSGNPDLNKILVSTNTNGSTTWKTLAELGGGGGGSGMINPMTDLGDMIYASASGTPAVASRLPIGTQGQILKVVNGIPDWEPAPSGGSNGWTDDGAVVRLTIATDKVGIGTSTPTQQLEITENFKLPNTTTNGGAGVIYDTVLSQQTRLLNSFNDSVFIGEGSGTLTSSANNNIGIGADSMFNVSGGSGNSSVGARSFGSSESGSYNVAFGSGSLSGGTTDRDYNVSIGEQSSTIDYVDNYCCGGSTVIVSENVAIGDGTLWAVVTQVGTYNVSKNVAVGNVSLHGDHGIKNGSLNLALGNGAGTNFDSLNNVTAIGYSANYVSTNNTMIFGNSSVTGRGLGVQPGANAITVGTNTTNGNGAHLTKQGEWQSTSDLFKKHNIQNINYGLEDIIKLRPVSFDWNGSNTKDIGFIAQEVKEVIPELVHGQEGDMTMSYGQMTAVLTKAVQELKEENELLNETLDLLEAEAIRQGY